MLSRRQFATALGLSLAMARQLPQSASAQPAAHRRLIIGSIVRQHGIPVTAHLRTRAHPISGYSARPGMSAICARRAG